MPPIGQCEQCHCHAAKHPVVIAYKSFIETLSLIERSGCSFVYWRLLSRILLIDYLSSVLLSHVVENSPTRAKSPSYEFLHFEYLIR